MTTEDKINIFKQDITSARLTQEQLFQKHIVDGRCHYFTHILKDEEKEYKLRQLVADYLDVYIHEVIIVGSAKLGFSISPKKLFHHFDTKFRMTRQWKDKSDIDVAVICEELFEGVGRNVFKYTNSLKDQWDSNEYYREGKFNVPVNYRYFEYFSKGWFRPDFKPRGFEISNLKSFEAFKKETTKLVDRKVTIAIYKNWFYFMNYHTDNLNEISHKKETSTL
ncbi:hypothetical protein [Pontibacter akesuensis]|uniref:Uncharacterized protein n=1 Tax=Pontibacter akesuensis TaxID=388950 RepID=A0A1I7JC67_9BACT|nr:hypothetical protein [Pontibacter akesuensis]GHA71068.1 hypothetical protein GCM10007389_25640 [Pontibacter akesuensis]SFU82748.1 hypothetical protein SAMN04487941_2702 [Pontibacter akesuensis]